MKSKALTVESYINELPIERQEAMNNLRNAFLKNLPTGYKEEISYGMIGYVVPHTLYPAGYHCTPKLPLPFVNIASQKNFIAIYHVGLYADKELLRWFETEYVKHSTTKLDMGKSCIRFKKSETIPYELIGELAKKMSVQNWINLYESSFKPNLNKKP